VGLRDARSNAYETSRPDVQALVPESARRILDVGCASGAIGAALKGRQAVEVIGVELDAELAADARRVLDDVLVGDADVLLTDPRTLGALGVFDCVIAADVLEHLRDPWTVLRNAAERLRAGGTAVVSLPNVRHVAVWREVFVRGQWPREDSGTFDRTHLRWFTPADAFALLEQAGLTPTRTVRKVWVERAPFRGAWRVANVLSRTPLEPFVVNQYVIAASAGAPCRAPLKPSPSADRC
jgi:2-polyprenyl-3-methyl-5-hydroxy-6-metoxy-1,4-benzoquinol methylase